MVNAQPRTGQEPGSRPSPNGTKSEVGVHCRDLRCTFSSERGSVTALDGVTFSARPHEFVCVVGPSGCGKSTLLRAIAGLVVPTSGSIIYEGALSQPRGGLVVQEHGTFPWMSVLDNVAFGLEMRGMPKAERRALAMDYIEKVGLAEFAHHYPHELSVGMRQRVAIGRAFVSDPPMFLMDEPFGALDAQTRWVLQAELLRIWSEHRKLVLFVTHDVQEAVLLGDRVLVLTGRPGRIREDIHVPLDRPRDARRGHHLLNELTWHIWRLLEQEVQEGLAVR